MFSFLSLSFSLWMYTYSCSFTVRALKSLSLSINSYFFCDSSCSSSRYLDFIFTTFGCALNNLEPLTSACAYTHLSISVALLRSARLTSLIILARSFTLNSSKKLITSLMVIPTSTRYYLCPFRMLQSKVVHQIIFSLRAGQISIVSIRKGGLHC